MDVLVICGLLRLLAMGNQAFDVVGYVWFGRWYFALPTASVLLPLRPLR